MTADTGLNLACSGTQKTGFRATRLTLRFPVAGEKSLAVIADSSILASLTPLAHHYTF